MYRGLALPALVLAPMLMLLAPYQAVAFQDPVRRCRCGLSRRQSGGLPSEGWLGASRKSVLDRSSVRAGVWPPGPLLQPVQAVGLVLGLSRVDRLARHEVRHDRVPVSGRSRENGVTVFGSSGRQGQRGLHQDPGEVRGHADPVPVGGVAGLRPTGDGRRRHGPCAPTRTHLRAGRWTAPPTRVPGEPLCAGVGWAFGRRLQPGPRWQRRAGGDSSRAATRMRERMLYVWSMRAGWALLSVGLAVLGRRAVVS